MKQPINSFSATKSVFICEWADKKDMWRYVDANSDGHLNYFEFCAAFQVEDKKNEREWCQSCAETDAGFPPRSSTHRHRPPMIQRLLRSSKPLFQRCKGTCRRLSSHSASLIRRGKGERYMTFVVYAAPYDLSSIRQTYPSRGLQGGYSSAQFIDQVCTGLRLVEIDFAILA